MATATKEEILKNLSWELKRELTWKELLNLVGGEVMHDVINNDVAAIIALRTALGLLPFC